MKEREEAGEWWGRARHRRVMGKSEREVRVMAKSRRDTQLMGKKSKRQANDGEEQATDKQMLGKSERQLMCI